MTPIRPPRRPAATPPGPSRAAPSRAAALRVYDSVTRGTGTLPDALAIAQATLPDARDRALAAEIVSGTFRWQAALDHALARFSSRPLDRLDPIVFGILRLSAYQLLFLDRVPARAVVFDAVALAREAAKASAAGFVNAVLRRLIDADRATLWPARPALPAPPPVPAASRTHEDAQAHHDHASAIRAGPGQARRGQTATELQNNARASDSEPPSAAAAVPVRRESGTDDALTYLAVTLSHPRWLVARWHDRYGFEAAEAWARFDNAPASLTLRANPLQTTRDPLAQRLAEAGVVCEPTRFAPEGLIVREGNPLQTPLARQGVFTTQDEASQLVACVAQAALAQRLGAEPAAHSSGPVGGDPPRPQPGPQPESPSGSSPGLPQAMPAVVPRLRVLDACAAPGGKTVALAAAVGRGGIVIATDRRRRRLRLLSDTITAAGAAARVYIAQLDLESPLPFVPVFDLVLVDAPCSGLGTLRREPEIRWRRTEDELPRFAIRQQRMLRHAAAGVRPGGRLVYATCSSEPEENEEVAVAFLAMHPAFRPVAAQDLPLPPAMTPAIDAAGHLRTWPFAHGLEAFFAAVFERTD